MYPDNIIFLQGIHHKGAGGQKTFLSFFDFCFQSFSKDLREGKGDNPSVHKF